MVLSTEEAAEIEIVTRGPEGLARAREARGSGSRENPERERIMAEELHW